MDMTKEDIKIFFQGLTAGILIMLLILLCVSCTANPRTRTATGYIIHTTVNDEITTTILMDDGLFYESPNIDVPMGTECTITFDDQGTGLIQDDIITNIEIKLYHDPVTYGYLSQEEK